MKTTFIFVLSFFLTITAFSQPKRSLEDRLKMIEQKICKPLSLNKTDTEKVKSYFNEFFIEVDKLSALGTPPNREKVEVLSQIRDNKIKLILSEEQYKKYVKLEIETRPKE